MDTLHALKTRTSSPRLTEPGPNNEQLENIYQAAFRAADHAHLRPWRFISIQGDSRNRLGELFLAASLLDDANLSEAKKDKILNKPLRAPLIITVVSCHYPHLKVPEIEQDFSAAAASQNMLLAAYAQNIGAVWRTGSMAFHEHVKKGLGLSDSEKIVAFLYMGTPALEPRSPEILSSADYVSNW